MPQSTAISVVIPAFNAADYVGEQLAALAQQTGDFPWEVIVADNGSRDETRAVVDSWTEQFPVPLRIVDVSSVRGAAHARNVGVRAAGSPLVTFRDADDVVDSAWVEAAHAGLLSADVVVGLNLSLAMRTDPDAGPLNPGALFRRHTA